MQITRLNGCLAARVSDIDWASGLTDEEMNTIGATLDDYGVLCIEAAQMSPDQHVALGKHFGELEHHEFFDNQGAGSEHITVLDSTRGDRANMWHVDEQFLQHPPIITMTHAIELPPYGGDTAFISLGAAFDGLSPRMKAYVDGLTALHDLGKIAELRWQHGNADGALLAAEVSKGKYASHPVVLTHPHTGRKGIYVSPTYTRWIEGLPPVEAKAILDFLYVHLQKPEFAYRHRWQTGDMMVWDNRSVMHYAALDFADRRLMHRISVIG